ncbi:hypothetical protein PCNPT3_00135 [Psychromonas sp. CNPT3]|uniref:beta-ketoacyl synthase chain length factor n=1 Tax=Psychromonas sp. CNPT3 TaxID=314282 RepID=UPI0002C06C08|nr:beta-ketoacyl synthase chain length factor [Psychromonas sp. CNPT3]AGH79969.1 hypothetical protein PCNPT3_00135 [Psychromonas sp. CNPT3]
MSSIEFKIDKWLALSPGLLNIEQWHDWSSSLMQWPSQLTPVPISLIKPMMRRRMSSLSKIAVQAALQLSAQEQVDYIVFASRHGELTRTVKLLEDIIKGDDASPLAFSQSVHNIAAGLFTICSGRATPVTSIAAVESSLHHGLIEASVYLQENPTHKVLLVDFDESLPEPYCCYEQKVHPGYAFAAILSFGSQFQLSWSKNKDDAGFSSQQSLCVIDYLLKNTRKVLISDPRLVWEWSRNR